MSNLLQALFDWRSKQMARVEGIRNEALAPLLERLKTSEENRQLARQRQQEQEQGVGLAQQLNRMGLTQDPTAQTAVGLMQNPGSRALGLQLAASRLDPQAQANLAQTQQQTAASRTQEALAQAADARDQLRTVAYVNNMNYDNAMKASQATLAATAQVLKSEEGLRSEFQKAPVVIKANQAIGSFQMLQRALREDNPIALQAAIVGIAQVQEPGLAVRNDDRIAYTGNNSVLENMVNAYNKAVSGTGLVPEMKARLLALGTQLAGVHAQNYLRIQEEYQRIAERTPGARPVQVTTGTGIDEDTVNMLAELTRQPRRGPGDR